MLGLKCEFEDILHISGCWKLLKLTVEVGELQVVEVWSQEVLKRFVSASSRG